MPAIGGALKIQPTRKAMASLRGTIKTRPICPRQLCQLTRCLKRIRSLPQICSRSVLFATRRQGDLDRDLFSRRVIPALWVTCQAESAPDLSRAADGPGALDFPDRDHRIASALDA